MHIISGARRHCPDDVIEFDRLMSKELNTIYGSGEELARTFIINLCQITAVLQSPSDTQLTLTVVL